MITQQDKEDAENFIARLSECQSIALLGEDDAVIDILGRAEILWICVAFTRAYLTEPVQ